MKIIRVQAVQAHAVPKTAHAPRGPFPPELQGFNPKAGELDVNGANLSELDEYEDDAHPAAQPEIITDYAPEQNEDGWGFEPGATAQNNFRPERRYRCRHCRTLVLENQIDYHECDE
jgi:hypothetical protein